MSYISDNFKPLKKKVGRPGFKSDTKEIKKEVLKTTSDIKHSGGQIREKGLIIVQNNAIKKYTVSLRRN